MVFKTNYRLMQVKSIAEWEHSAILLTFIKLPFVIKVFVMSIFEWPFYTGFTVFCYKIDISDFCFMHILHQIEYKMHFCSGSVVECLIRDQGAAGSSLTGVSALCP